MHWPNSRPRYTTYNLQVRYVMLLHVWHLKFDISLTGSQLNGIYITKEKFREQQHTLISTISTVPIRVSIRPISFCTVLNKNSPWSFGEVLWDVSKSTFKGTVLHTTVGPLNDYKKIRGTDYVVFVWFDFRRCQIFYY